LLIAYRPFLGTPEGLNQPTNEENAMYIGVGTLLLIVILLIIFF
jgi:hypothetical protein